MWCRLKETSLVSTSLWSKRLGRFRISHDREAIQRSLPDLANEEQHKGPHIWLILAIPERTHHPAPTGQPPVPFNCGQWPCVSTSELSWGPLTAPNTWVQSRTQRAIQVCTAIENLQKGTRMIPASLSHWQVFQEAFIGQWILPCLKVKVCFRSRAWPFPDLSPGLHSITICPCPPREYSPTLPCGKTHQTSLGYSAACSSLCEQWSCTYQGLTSDLTWAFLSLLALFFLKSRWMAYIAHYSCAV